VRADIDRLVGTNTFRDRLAAQKTLEGFIANNRLTPAQYGILRTYPAMPDSEQTLRKGFVLLTWNKTFPSVGAAIDQTRFQTLERSVGRDWFFKVDGFFGGADTGNPVVVGYYQRYEDARNALVTADTAQAFAKVEALRNYVLDPMNFDRFNLATDPNLRNRVTQVQAAAVFDQAINATQQAIRDINLGSNNVMPPPRQPVPVQGQGAIDVGRTLQLALSNAPVMPGGLDVLLTPYDLALSVPPPGFAFVGEVFDLRATDGLDITGSTVALGIELDPSTNLSGLRMARLANGRMQLLDDFVIDPSTFTVTGFYQPESASSGEDQFGEFAVVRAVPEPAGIVMMGFGVLGLVGYGYRRIRRSGRSRSRGVGGDRTASRVLEDASPRPLQLRDSDRLWAVDPEGYPGPASSDGEAERGPAACSAGKLPLSHPSSHRGFRTTTLIASRSDRLVILALLGLVALADRAAAQTEPPDNQNGPITIEAVPMKVGNPVTKLVHFEHAWWDTAKRGEARYTLGQADTFVGWGYDSRDFSRGGKLLNARVPPNAKGEFPQGAQPTAIMTASQIVTPNPNGGNAQSFSFQKQAGDSPSDHATARSEYTLSPYQADGKTFTLTMTAKQYENRNPLPGMNSYAYSSAGMSYRNEMGAMKNGRIGTTYASSAGHIGSPVAMQSSMNFLPMSFQTFDRSGNPQLFNQYYNSVAGTIDNATFGADSIGYHLATATSDGEAALNIHVDGSYLSNVTTGDLNVDLVDGVVMQENATGFFRDVTFAYNLVNGVTTLDITNLPPLSFTFNIPDNGDPSNTVLFEVDNDAFAAASVPEPPSLVMVGTAMLAGLVYAWHRRRARISA
jgi:hypothetical protein